MFSQYGKWHWHLGERIISVRRSSMYNSYLHATAPPFSCSLVDVSRKTERRDRSVLFSLISSSHSDRHDCSFGGKIDWIARRRQSSSVPPPSGPHNPPTGSIPPALKGRSSELLWDSDDCLFEVRTRKAKVTDYDATYTRIS